MRKILVGAGIVLLLVVAGLLAAPSFIDWNEHRERIASWLSETLGRDVAIDGPLRLTLLPTPHLSAGGVRIAAAPGAAEPDLLRVRAVEATVAPAALLSGRIAVTQASLADPVLTVERLPDGRMSWTRPERAPGDSGSDRAPPNERRDSGGNGGFTVAVDRLTIANGTVVYRDGAAPGATARRAGAIDAVVTIAGPSGPIRVQGNFTALGGRAFRLTASTERLDPATPTRRIPLLATLEAPQDHGRVEVSGEAALDPEPAFKGKLRLGGDDAAALAAAFLGHAPAAAKWPGAFAGRLDATASVVASTRSVALDPFSLEIGETRGNGAVRVEPGSPAAVTASLAIPRLDLDRAAAAGMPERPVSSSAATATADAQTGTVTATSPTLFAIRTNLPAAAVALRGSLDLHVDAIIWRAGLVRDTRLEATLDGGELRIARASALLPGGTDVRVQGAVQPGAADNAGAAAVRGDGTIEADADNLRGTLDWLGVGTADVPADRLRRTSLRARLALAGERLDIDDLALSLDASRLSGVITVALRDRIGIGARLVVDQINLDAYRPTGGGPGNAGAAAGVAAMPTSGTAPQAGRADARSTSAAAWPAALDGFDANLDIAVGTLTAGGQPAEGAHLVGALRQGDLTVSEMSLRNLAGTSLKASGLVSRVGRPDAAVQAAFEAKGEAIDRLLRLADAPSALATQITGPFTASGDLHGEAGSGRMAVDVEATALGGGRLHASGEVGRHRLDLLLDAAHPSTAVLLRQIAPSYHPAAGGDLGALTLSGHLARGEGGRSWRVDDLGLSVGDAMLLENSEITLMLNGPRPALRADLRVGDLAVDRFLPASRSADAATTAPPTAILRPGILLAQAAGRSSAADRSGGASRWPQSPFDLAALGAVDAEATVAGRRLAYGAWKLETPDVVLSLKDGVLAAPKLAGTLFGGALSGQGRLAVLASGEAPPDASAVLTLRQADLRPLLGETIGAHVDGRLDLDADLAAAGRSPADLVASLGGTARIASRDGTLSGIDVQAVSDRLKDTSRAADFLALGRAIAGGTTRYRTLDGTFRIEHGVARSDDLKLTADAAAAEASATLDLPRWQVRSRVAFSLIEHPKAPPLVLTLDGSLDDPRKVVEINPFQRYLTQHNAEQQQRSGNAPPPAEGQQQ